MVSLGALNGVWLSLVEHSLWERGAVGSNPITPTHIQITTLDFYSVEQWQENWDELMSRVENGETIGIVNENGDKAVMVPADDEIFKIYTELNNEAQ